MSFTKGNWRICNENHHIVESEKDGQIKSICMTLCGRDSGVIVYEESLANAKIISCIPYMIEYLQWYAKESNWNTDWQEYNPAIKDRGAKARLLLALMNVEVA